MKIVNRFWQEIVLGKKGKIVVTGQGKRRVNICCKELTPLRREIVKSHSKIPTHELKDRNSLKREYTSNYLKITVLSINGS